MRVKINLYINVSYQNRATALSQNAKLGEGVATNYRPVGDSAKGLGTCPSGCSMLNNGCYADKALVKMQAQKSRTQFDSLDKLLQKGVKFIRLHTSGDFFIADESGYILDLFYWLDVLRLAKNNPDVTIWTYCHDVSKIVEAGFDYNNGSIPKNLHITASVDNETDQMYAASYGFRTARVIANPEEKHSNETLCPYDLQLYKGKKRTVKCVTCKLCFNPKHLKDIAFVKHK